MLTVKESMRVTYELFQSNEGSPQSQRQTNTTGDGFWNLNFETYTRVSWSWADTINYHNRKERSICSHLKVLGISQNNLITAIRQIILLGRSRREYSRWGDIDTSTS